MSRRKEKVEIKVVVRNGRKYVVIPYSFYKELIQLIDEIIEIYDMMEGDYEGVGNK